MDTENPFDKKVLANFCEHACALFIERRVSTMFKINFLDLMKKRMNVIESTVEVEKMLDEVTKKDVKFLTKILCSKGVMIQITKENYN